MLQSIKPQRKALHFQLYPCAAHLLLSAIRFLQVFLSPFLQCKSTGPIHISTCVDIVYRDTNQYRSTKGKLEVLYFRAADLWMSLEWMSLQMDVSHCVTAMDGQYNNVHCNDCRCKSCHCNGCHCNDFHCNDFHCNDCRCHYCHCNGCHCQRDCHCNGCHCNDCHCNGCHCNDFSLQRLSLQRLLLQRLSLQWLSLPMSVTAMNVLQEVHVLRFHIFNCHFLRDVWPESFVSTSSTFSFWETSRTKASFPQVQFAVNELRKVFGNEFLLDFLVFGAFHFPFRTPVQRLQNRTFFRLSAERSAFGAGVSCCQHNSFGFCSLVRDVRRA